VELITDRVLVVIAEIKASESAAHTLGLATDNLD
jgi:hypothetical protein